MIIKKWMHWAQELSCKEAPITPWDEFNDLVDRFGDRVYWCAGTKQWAVRRIPNRVFGWPALYGNTTPLAIGGDASCNYIEGVQAIGRNDCDINESASLPVFVWPVKVNCIPLNRLDGENDCDGSECTK
jgi:hypothetical protein